MSTKTYVTVIAVVTQTGVTKWPCSQAVRSTLLMVTSSCAAEMLHLTLSATTEMVIPNSSHLSRKRQFCIYSVIAYPPQRSRPSLDIRMVTIGGRGEERRSPPSAHCGHQTCTIPNRSEESDLSRSLQNFGIISFRNQVGQIRATGESPGSVLSIQGIMQIHNRSLALLAPTSCQSVSRWLLLTSVLTLHSSAGYRAKPTVDAMLPFLNNFV